MSDVTLNYPGGELPLRAVPATEGNSGLDIGCIRERLIGLQSKGKTNAMLFKAESPDEAGRFLTTVDGYLISMGAGRQSESLKAIPKRCNCGLPGCESNKCRICGESGHNGRDCKKIPSRCTECHKNHLRDTPMVICSRAHRYDTTKCKELHINGIFVFCG